ncbi:DNA polymerase III subunit gamma/tau [Pantoea sp. Aalb]|uniref:DNA polymerase III subunit gamma/tau n=1 Tax=Pantoea sp. Aalb TaxID=2576762 RepID=UPI00132AD8B0|nr:DNA polymerase III subunit gamma/tau [Pantoea sp. Aalb]MXP67569.1 DNA polymerase III subunit gamma/tau [Pantoea sp. Aalb]
MSYKVLARKWRPQIFADVVGQKYVLAALTNGLSQKRIHHAYLFSGTRGVGKTSIARLFVKGLNCEIGITEIPCGQCKNCREIEEGHFIDLIEIDAASRTKVEDTLDLLDNVQYASVCGRFKVYLIDEVHMLSRHSFNALLKILEEPPLHVKFLLATTEPQKLPSTIISRCLQFHLKSLSIEQIQQQLEYILKQEHIQSEPRALYLISNAAHGSMRDALSLTEQAIAIGHGSIRRKIVVEMLGMLDDEQPLSLIEALVEGKVSEVMELLNYVALQSIEWESLLVEMIRLLHRIAMIQLLPTSLKFFNDDNPKNMQRLCCLARVLPPTDVQLYYQILLMGRKELPLAPNHRLGVEMTMLRALVFHPQENISYPIQEPILKTQKCSQFSSEYENTKLHTVKNLTYENLFPLSSNSEEISKLDNMPNTINHLLKARSQLLKENKLKKSNVTDNITENIKQNIDKFPITTLDKLKLSCWENNQKSNDDPLVTTYKNLELNHKIINKNDIISKIKKKTNTDELSVTQEVLNEKRRDIEEWISEITTFVLPESAKQLALNSWKEINEKGIVTLHLRSSHQHLNSTDVYKLLQDAISKNRNKLIKLIIIIDDDYSKSLTPIEWYHSIYQKKLKKAHQSIKNDIYVQTLRQLFDADLDEESIIPI